ncbi:MAG: hypothetical protein CMP14_04055 [Rickettsiales bacterium]|nr:hypothetical protein [Rickettsiales bacterium]
MQTRTFGRTALELSLLTFGCGAVGGLMTKGASSDQDRAVAWARDNGINHFDTAPSYGNTASETNLGRALGPNRDNIFISTKVGVTEEYQSNLAGAIRTSLEASLMRLAQDHVDIFQLHNTLEDPSDQRGNLSADKVLEEIVPTFEKLRDEGKTRYIGFTAKGSTEALHRLMRSNKFDSAQIFYNLVVPSAGRTVPNGYPGQDYEKLLTTAHQKGVGSIAVRVLAGGALSASEVRHPLGNQNVTPIGSGRTYAEDIARALKFQPLIDAGHAKNLPELAIRYGVSNSNLSTLEIGIATIEELQNAAVAVNKGPLSEEALTQIFKIQDGFAS